MNHTFDAPKYPFKPPHCTTGDKEFQNYVFNPTAKGCACTLTFNSKLQEMAI